MALRIGELIGDYQVVDLLGTGGMGSVYRVRNRITDREEAMKILLPDLRSVPDLEERFGREIKIQASLDHPNIAALRTAVRVDNQLLMIMELVDGVTLEKRLKLSPVDFWLAIEWTTQVLAALSYAHERGIIHRDIKPANIMINRANAVKLTDFGVASIATIGRLTRTGMALGSLHYMSPEQIQSGQPDARSDIYSLGITLYQVLAGRRPFEGESEYEIMRSHIEREPAPLSSLNATVPYPVAVAVMRAMAKRPEERFQSAEEFRAMLELAKGSTPPSMERPTPVPGLSTPASKTPASTPRLSQSLGADAMGLERIERVRKELAHYIGPLARIFIERAAKKALTLSALYEMVAPEISAAKDREEFLKKRPR